MGTPNPAVDLTTVANIHTWLNIPTGNTGQDDLFQMLITAESQLIANYCNRNFISQDYTEVRDGTGSRELMMKQWPITAVSSVQINNDVVPYQSQFSQNVPFVTPGWNSWGGPLPTSYYWTGRRILARLGAWPRGQANLLVSYTAGYPADALPADLIQAATELVAFRYKQSTRVGIGGGQAIDGQNVNFGGTGSSGLSGSNMGDMPQSVKTALQHYRKVMQVLTDE